jgi:hypothetical protein
MQVEVAVDRNASTNRQVQVPQALWPDEDEFHKFDNGFNRLLQTGALEA